MGKVAHPTILSDHHLLELFSDLKIIIFQDRMMHGELIVRMVSDGNRVL
jgi:hypothetical protein